MCSTQFCCMRVAMISISLSNFMCLHCVIMDKRGLRLERHYFMSKIKTDLKEDPCCCWLFAFLPLSCDAMQKFNKKFLGKPHANTTILCIPNSIFVVNKCSLHITKACCVLFWHHVWTKKPIICVLFLAKILKCHK